LSSPDIAEISLILLTYRYSLVRFVSSDIAEIYDYEEFNAAEIAQYRGILDDIAKEVGGRVQKTEHSGEMKIGVVGLGIDTDKI